jgi:hypothetical protein
MADGSVERAVRAFFVQFLTLPCLIWERRGVRAKIEPREGRAGARKIHEKSRDKPRRGARDVARSRRLDELVRSLLCIRVRQSDP